MNVKIRSKDIALNANLKAHIEQAIEEFKKFQLEITTVNVNVSVAKNGAAVEFDIHVAHATPVVISNTDESLDAAIDLAIERASKALRRLHDKVVSKQASSLRDFEAVED